MATTFTKIFDYEVGSGGAASIDFTSIPNTYTDLCLKVSARTSEAQSIGPMIIQFNGSTTSYSSRELAGAGSGTPSSASRGVLNNGLYLGNGVGNSATANTFDNMEIYIPNYAGSTNKSLSVDHVGEDNATTAYATFVAGLWSNTAAITSIKLYPFSGSTNLTQYSTATLYGVNNA
jgi:hypothetical protein